MTVATAQVSVETPADSAETARLDRDLLKARQVNCELVEAGLRKDNKTYNLEQDIASLPCRVQLSGRVSAGPAPLATRRVVPVDSVVGFVNSPRRKVR